ncbi:MAG: SUMF1/EgtB/PvdO family nonheme iron enzyme [Anaerolineales bacterium]|nr:SUMF1/EgtB/PvdO family nonheme iron enzyme [Anaerolineales bacterium]MBX3035330.1 SUMF1/EgtB/PvdO family nonheme iron enzyme [Anaerolineales bacterium]
MPRQLRVFLCHASQDKPAVKELYQRLKAEDWIDPWLDVTKLLPGQDWWKVIEKSVEEADVVIICLSNQSINKEGVVQREIKYAFGVALDKLDESIFLIPVRLDECNVPKKLRDYQWLDYYGDNKEYSDNKLLEALKHRYTQVLHLEAEQIRLKQIEEQKREEEARRLADEQRKEKERLDNENAKQIRREIRRRELEKKLKRDIKRQKQKEFFNNFSHFFQTRIRLFFVAGVVLIGILGVLFIGNYLFRFSNGFLNNISLSPTSMPATPTLTETLFEPTKIFTPTVTDIPFTPTIALTPTPQYRIGSIIVSEMDGMVLVYIPTGEFIMGNDKGKENERPAHQVYLSAYWLDQTEVTNKMYKQCVSIGPCSPPNVLRSETRDTYFYNPAFENYPVVSVTWQMAYDYCQWAGRRLPTEAEWEKSARGIDERIYPWGNEIPKTSLLNYSFFIGDTTLAGSYPRGASYYGAVDMAGNVWEWVNDFYDEIYYVGSPKVDPQGPLPSLGLENRVMRGGSWRDGDTGVRVTNRSWHDQRYTLINLGFRCAMDADQ